MVVCHKSIGINTFNVFVIDLQDKLIKYWHEGYQLWESESQGLMSVLEGAQTTNIKGESVIENISDFIILSQDGIHVMSLGKNTGRILKDSLGFERFMHALGSVDCVKIDPTNHLLFSC